MALYLGENLVAGLYLSTLNTYIGNTGTTLNTGLVLSDNLLVFKNGVLLTKGSGNDFIFTIGASTITFTTALTSTDKIDVINGGMNIITAPTNASIIATSVSIDAQANVNYICSNPLTSLTLVSAPNSSLETNIYFTTDSSNFSFTNNSSITKWIGVAPAFNNGKSYVINICNGIGCLAEVVNG